MFRRTYVDVAKKRLCFYAGICSIEVVEVHGGPAICERWPDVRVVQHG